MPVCNTTNLLEEQSFDVQQWNQDLSDILQKHSINCLMQRDLLSRDSPSPELLGLNSPRGFFGPSFGGAGSGGSGGGGAGTSTPKVSSPPGFHTPPAAQSTFGENNFMNFSSVLSGGNDKRCLPSTAGITDSDRSAFPYHTMRSTSLSSDCSGSNSPTMLERNRFCGSKNSRSNTPSDSDNSAISTPDGSLTEIMNSLTLSEAYNCLNNSQDSDLNLQGLHALQAMKLLQQPQNFLSSILNPTCSHNSLQSLDKWGSLGVSSLGGASQQNLHLDKAARFHKYAASVSDATCTWSGVLPPRVAKPSGYSSKVFLGGVPWDISEQLLVQTFRQFGPIRAEWPGKDKQAAQPKGYVYIIFECEKNVKALLQACTNDYQNGGNWYYKISSKRMKSKEVQVIPWVLNDSNYTKSTSQKLDPSKTVFVGALHGMLNAEGLAQIMNDLFDGVVYAGIDTDKFKYPIGSGRVTFNNPRSYMKAVAAGFIEIRTAKFTKKVQVDPYLEDSLCSLCTVQQGPYFCRDLSCFRYYCRPCWMWRHGAELRHHRPLMRNSKNSTVVGFD